MYCWSYIQFTLHVACMNQATSQLHLRPPGTVWFQKSGWWNSQFEQFWVTSGLTLDSVDKQFSTLLYCLGEQAETVLTSTNITGEECKVYETVIAKASRFTKMLYSSEHSSTVKNNSKARVQNTRIYILMQMTQTSAEPLSSHNSQNFPGLRKPRRRFYWNLMWHLVHLAMFLCLYVHMSSNIWSQWGYLQGRQTNTLVCRDGCSTRQGPYLCGFNESVLRELHPLHKVDETFAQLTGAWILDANRGFWQISLLKESRLLTTFITPFGH